MKTICDVFEKEQKRDKSFPWFWQRNKDLTGKDLNEINKILSSNGTPFVPGDCYEKFDKVYEEGNSLIYEKTTITGSDSLAAQNGIYSIKTKYKVTPKKISLE